MGVYLPANAVRAIGELGLADGLAERAYRVLQQRFLDHRGRVLMEVDLADVWGDVGACLAIRHADLHELLEDDVPVSRGTTVTARPGGSTTARRRVRRGRRGRRGALVGALGGFRRERTAVPGAGQLAVRRRRRGRNLRVDRVAGPPGRRSSPSRWAVAARTATPPSTGVRRPTRRARTRRRWPPCSRASPSRCRRSWPAGGPGAVLLADRGGRPAPLDPRSRRARRGRRARDVAQHGRGRGHGGRGRAGAGRRGRRGSPLEEYEARRRPRVEFVQAQTHRRDRTRNLPAFVRDPVLRARGQHIFRSNYAALTAAP